MQFVTQLPLSSARYLALHKASSRHVTAEMFRFRPPSFSNLVSFFCCVDVLSSTKTIVATCFVHIVAILMTAIMILHVRSKYTAVGKFIKASEQFMQWIDTYVSRSKGDRHVFLPLCLNRISGYFPRLRSNTHG